MARTDRRGRMARHVSMCIVAASIWLTAGWPGLPQAQAAFFKLAAIHPALPRFVLLEKSTELMAKASVTLGGKSSVAETTKVYSPLEAFGHNTNKLPPDLTLGKLQFVELQPKPILPKATAAAPDRYADLRGWYAPAAELAAKRPEAAFYAADRARRDFSLVVGLTAEVDWPGSALQTPAALQQAQQLANRLIHAALEDTPQPEIFGRAESTGEVRQRLIDALYRAEKLGARPIGSHVWSELLGEEFPPTVYEPKGKVYLTNDPAILSYRVDSWLLPSTQTPIYAGAYAQAAVTYQYQARQMWNSLTTKK